MRVPFRCARMLEVSFMEPPMLRSKAWRLCTSRPAELSFVAEEKYVDDAKVSKAMALVVSKDFPEISKPLIRVLHPRLAWARVVGCVCAAQRRFRWAYTRPPSSAKDVVLGHNVSIQAYAFIKARSGSGITVIYPGVYIRADVRIGDNTVIT